MICLRDKWLSRGSRTIEYLQSMRFDVLTLFPEMVDHAVRCGVTGKAIDRGLVKLILWNPRDFATDSRRTVDDRPYGGGPGMVMKVQPLRDAIRAAKQENQEHTAKVIYLSPQGRPLTQDDLLDFAAQERIILLAGRYEGVDERLIESEIDEEWSLGDYVLSGGELAALVVIDGVTRLLPGALGADESSCQDSYRNGLLDYPDYTRPESIYGRSIPEVLKSGDHAAIARWRMKQALGRTWYRRPDLLNKYTLDADQKQLLKEFINEEHRQGE